MAFVFGNGGALGGLPQRRLQQIGGLTFDSPITTFLIVIGVICFSAPAIWWCGAFCAAPACQLPRCLCTHARGSRRAHTHTAAGSRDGPARRARAVPHGRSAGV
jgi:hypothetical protein